jgi:hypothetical protein
MGFALNRETGFALGTDLKQMPMEYVLVHLLVHANLPTRGEKERKEIGVYE